MEILFTLNNSFTSKLIRGILHEPVSHCALRVGEFVIDSDFTGVDVVPYSEFIKKNEVKFRVYTPTDTTKLVDLLAENYDKSYDFGAFMYLTLRYVLPFAIPKRNLWQTSGMFLCTEFVSKYVTKKEDSMVTPYQLYKILREYFSRDVN